MRVDTTSPTKPFYEPEARPTPNAASQQRFAKYIERLAGPLFQARYLRVQEVTPDAPRHCFWLKALSLNHRFPMRFCLPWEEIRGLRNSRELMVYLIGQARAAAQLDFELQSRVRDSE